MLRTHTCGQLTEKDAGKGATLCGWVHKRRDHGDLIFIDLRDRYGITQIVFNPRKDRELHTRAHSLKSEYVIKVIGAIERRPAETENPKIPTGKIELAAESFEVLSLSDVPPLEVEDASNASEDIRLLHRYLDLRRPRMQRRIELRHKVCKKMRDYLDKRGFLEVETPILNKSTPEGARDFLVPSRLSPGAFFALPQSPQIFKQILMVSGVDKYFQIVKCFRDEDLRADRQPEFTQLDMEASFVEEEDIYEICEGLIRELYKEALGADITTPFERLTYSEAMENYGSDKPDLRFGCKIADLTAELKDTGFKIFKQAVASGGEIKGIAATGCASMSLSKINELIQFVQEQGAKGLAYFKAEGATLTSNIKKFFTDKELGKIKDKTGAADGDMVFIVAGRRSIALDSLGALRLRLADDMKWIKKDAHSALWVCDFPLFKYNEEEKRWETEHHPFTSPKTGTLEGIDDLGSIKAKAYDLVINGVELASGSIRIHDAVTQHKVFEAIGIKKEEAESRFGFLLRAFKYGVPPHGGIAFGLDRMMTLFTKDRSIREVIAFPKTQKGVCTLSGAPSGVPDEQLRELGIKLRK